MFLFALCEDGFSSRFEVVAALAIAATVRSSRLPVTLPSLRVRIVFMVPLALSDPFFSVRVVVPFGLGVEVFSLLKIPVIR